MEKLVLSVSRFVPLFFMLTVFSVVVGHYAQLSGACCYV